MHTVVPPVVSLHRIRTSPVSRVKLSRLADLLYKKEHIPAQRGISLVFCSDSFMRQLNARYRSVNRTTDVLSFPFGDEDLLGEIYIAPRYTSAMLKRSGLSLQKEILRLFIHGFYHLLGYDHGTDHGKRKMIEKEETAFIDFIE